MKFIQTKFKNFHNEKFNYEKLFLNYWKNKTNINTKFDLSMFQNISLDEFRSKLIEYYLDNSYDDK